MFSWMSKDESRAKHGDIYEGVAEGLKGIYKYVDSDNMSQVIETYCHLRGRTFFWTKSLVNVSKCLTQLFPVSTYLSLFNCHYSRQKLLPLEKEYQFHDFHSPALDDPDFDARSQAHGSCKGENGPLPPSTARRIYFSSTSVSERVIFHSRPMVMLVGQYSTGKTTFIRYLLEQV